MKHPILIVLLALACKQSGAPAGADTSGSPGAAAPTNAAPAATPTSASPASGERNYITMVGSSTVYAFATVVAEQFGKTSKFKSPKVESTGTGGGLKLFCAGVGLSYPDIANASRRIKPSEVSECRKNGVQDIVELKIGYDGIVVANSKRSPPLELGLRQLWLALAKRVPDGDGPGTKSNPNLTWRDVDASLPAAKIEILGPPPTSGTRDAFVELALEGGCNTFDWIKALKATNEPEYRALCHTIREDGAFVEMGENDNLIVQKLEANPNAFGVFGFSFLDQNSEKVQATRVNAVSPTVETVSAATYPISRPLYMYVKKAHVGLVPGISEYIAELTHSRAWGPEGYLVDKGMVPMPELERQQFQAAASRLQPLEL